MRKICVALCFSLFASLIHAAGMPIKLTANASHHQIAAIDNSAHHCDEVASNSHDTNTSQPCHSASYQCCLGLVLVPILSIDLVKDIKVIFNPQYFSLALQPMIYFIYKPPRA